MRRYALIFCVLAITSQAPRNTDAAVDRTQLPTADALVDAAIARTRVAVTYDGSYRRLDYPNGDVPNNIGVCTDLVIRAYRAAARLDLQRLVHEDMKRAFSSYPKQWGLSRTDRNIDHRRVPNLRRFLERQGASLSVASLSSSSAEAVQERFLPGDLVTWMLPGNRPHIGVVTDRADRRTGFPLIAHNIGAGPMLEDMLFAFKITGHYRWTRH